MSERRVRSLNDGQLGFLEADSEGNEWVRLDRGNGKGRLAERLPYRPGEWAPDERAKFTPSQRAQVAYACDRELRMVCGEYSVPEWRQLGDGKLRVLHGPSEKASQMRREAWAAVMAVLERY